MINYWRDGNEWVFSTGERLKVVSGSSDLGDLSIPGLNNEPDLSEFTKGVLEQIEESDRPIVQKYIKDWDKAVQTEFTSRAEKLKPWEELGPYEDVTKALSWIGAMNDDPLKFYNDYAQALKEAGMLNDPNEKLEDFSNLPEYEGLPEGFVKKYSSMEKELNDIKQKFEGFTSTLEEREIEQRVDKLLKDLHTEHGQFDDDWVLLQMSRNGTDPQEAVKMFQTEIVEKYSSPRKPPPNILPGNGSVPSGQVDLSKMTREQKMSYAISKLKMENAAARGE